MKKILLIQHANSIGGSFQSFRLQLENIPKDILEKHDVEILLNRPTKDIKDYFKLRGFKTHELKLEFFQNTTCNRSSNIFSILINLINIFWCSLKFYIFLRNKNFNIIYFNSYVLTPYTFVSKLISKKTKNILHVREVKSKTLFNFRNRLGELILKRCTDKIIYLTNFDKNNWNVNGTVIPNSFSFRDKFQNKEIKFKNILYMGGHSELKGLEKITKSLKILFNKDKTLRLIFLGSPIRYNIFQRILFKLLNIINIAPRSYKLQLFLDSLGESLVYRNTTPHIDLIFKDIDCLIFPASRPHFPRPYIEASSFLIPSVIINHPYYQDFLSHRENVMLSDYDDFHKKILELKDNEQLYKCITNNAFTFSRNNFSIESNMPKIWEEIIGA